MNNDNNYFNSDKSAACRIKPCIKMLSAFVEILTWGLLTIISNNNISNLYSFDVDTALKNRFTEKIEKKLELVRNYFVADCVPANLLILSAFDNTSTIIGKALLDKFLVSFLIDSIMSPASSKNLLGVGSAVFIVPFVIECNSVRTTVGKSSSSTIFKADTVNKNTSVYKNN